jgi:hypothetical protein
VNVNSLIIAYRDIIINRGVIIFADFVVCLRCYHTLQGDNSLKSVERFEHMMFVCRFQASR